MPVEYRDINGLRAIAVLSVVLYHIGMPGLSGGFVGVDIFFVISGFLITRIIMRDREAGEFSIATFYVRRARRILPAYIVVVVAAAVVGLVLLPPADFVSFSKSVAASALFIANIYFSGEMSYFQDAAEQLPLLHLWSLSVEEQFYLVWPFFAGLVLYRLKPRWALIVLCIGTAAALAAAEWALRTKSSTLVFFWTPFRIWELMLGAVVALAPVVRIRPAGVRLGLALIAFLGIAGTVIFYRPDSPPFPGLSAFPACFGTALAIYLGQQGGGNPLTSVLSTGPLGFVGKISYSLYLWHWPILAYAKVALGSPLSPTVSAIAVGASFLLAVGSWYFVETPFRRAKSGQAAVVLPVAAVSLMTLFALGASGVMLQGLPQRATQEALRVAASIDPSDIAEACLRERDPDTISHQPEGCQWGDGPATEVVWGDSHAAAYYIGMEERAKATGATIELRGMQSCDPLWSLGARAAKGRAEAACELFNRSVMDLVSTTPTVRRILINGYWSNRLVDLKDYRGDAAPDVSEADIERLRDDATRVVSQLKAAGKEVVLLGEPPAFPTGGGGCIRQRAFMRAPWSSCDVTRQWADGVAGRINAVLSVVAREHDVQFVDPIPAFCDAVSCAPYSGGEVLYRDRHHMNDIGSRLVTRLFLVPDGSPSPLDDSPG